MKLTKTISILSCLWLSISVQETAIGQEIESPNGELEMEFSLQENGIPTYELSYKGQPVIEESHLGLELKKQEDLTENFEVEDIETSEFDETWKPVWGEVDEIRNHYNEMAVSLEQEETGRKMIIRFRLFNDGLGFRYEFPQQEKMGHMVVENEKANLP